MQSQATQQGPSRSSCSDSPSSATVWAPLDEDGLLVGLALRSSYIPYPALPAQLVILASQSLNRRSNPETRSRAVVVVADPSPSSHPVAASRVSSTSSSSRNMSGLPDSFDLFPLLPAELRLQIWRHSCHQRVVEVSYDGDDDRCASSTAPPAILHVCRESRFEALRIYKKSFGTRSHEPRIYFCPNLDTLYLPRPSFMGYDDACRLFTELVQGTDDTVNLAIDYVRPSIRRPWETYNKYVLMQSFPKVKEVDLVLEDGESAEGEGYHEHDQHGHEHALHEHEDIGLVDPTGDLMALCRLLADVKESFFYEAGTDYTIGDAKEDFYEQPVLPPLVLKSKVISSH